MNLFWPGNSLGILGCNAVYCFASSGFVLSYRCELLCFALQCNSLFFSVFDVLCSVLLFCVVQGCAMNYFEFCTVVLCFALLCFCCIVLCIVVLVLYCVLQGCVSAVLCAVVLLLFCALQCCVFVESRKFRCRQTECSRDTPGAGRLIRHAESCTN